MSVVPWEIGLRSKEALALAVEVASVRHRAAVGSSGVSRLCVAATLQSSDVRSRTEHKVLKNA